MKIVDNGNCDAKFQAHNEKEKLGRDSPHTGPTNRLAMDASRLMPLTYHISDPYIEIEFKRFLINVMNECERE